MSLRAVCCRPRRAVHAVTRQFPCLDVVYGEDHFGRCEGFNGQLWTSSSLNRNKTNYRSLLEALFDVTIVFALFLSLAIQYRELTGAPPVGRRCRPRLSPSRRSSVHFAHVACDSMGQREGSWLVGHEPPPRP